MLLRHREIAIGSLSLSLYLSSWLEDNLNYVKVVVVIVVVVVVVLFERRKSSNINNNNDEENDDNNTQLDMDSLMLPLRLISLVSMLVASSKDSTHTIHKAFIF